MKTSAVFTILLLSFSLALCAQPLKNDNPKPTYKALAKLISGGEGSKIYIAKYKIIKDFTDTTFADTIQVGYYFYNDNSQHFDTVLLTLEKYDGKTEHTNYFICPDYDARTGIQKAKISFIDFEYWEGCETGKGACNPLTFTREKNEKNWFLIMPCGGTSTSITISSQDNNFFQKQNLFGNQCPPFLELTNLKDGKYVANMMACGLGGGIAFNLITQQ